MPRIQFTVDLASTLEFYPPEGRPDASATLNIYTSGDSPLTGTFPATVALDSVNTTTTAAAAQRATELSLTSGTGIVAGRRYSIKLASGQRIEVVARGVDGTTMYLDQPLSVAVGSGDTVQGHRLAYSLSAEQNGDQRRRVRASWSYDVDGDTYAWQQYYSVVREPFLIPVTESDIELHDHTFGAYVDRFGSWKRLIPGAHDIVAEMIEAEEMYPDLIKDRDGLKTAIIYCILAMFYRTSPGQSDKADAMMTQCERAVSRVLSARTWYDRDDDQVIDGDPVIVTLADGSQVTVISDDSGYREIGRDDELGLPASYLRVG